MKMALVATKAALLAMTLNYGVHLGSSFAYMKFCLPQDLYDTARAFVTTASPMCTMLLSTMQLTQNNVAVVITTSIAAIVAGALKPA